MDELIKEVNIRKEQRLRTVMLHSIIAQQIDAHHGGGCYHRMIGSIQHGRAIIHTQTIDGRVEKWVGQVK